MQKTRKKIIFLVLGLIFCFFGSINFTHATEPISLKISPLTYKLTIKKGESETQVVSIINPNQVSIKVIAETQDFIQEDEEGSPKFIDKSVGKTTLAQWIDINREAMTLVPNEKRDVPFTINAPKDAESGGHYAAIFFKTVPDQTQSGQISITSRVGSLVLVTVPGDIISTGEIVEFKAPKFSEKGPINFLARFKDTGTVHYQLGGTITITNFFGKEVARLSLPEHIVLPDSIRRFETQWSENRALGRYEAELEMRDGDGNLRTQSLVFYIFPWKISLAILGGIILLILIIILIKRALKKKEDKTIEIRQE